MSLRVWVIASVTRDGTHVVTSDRDSGVEEEHGTTLEDYKRNRQRSTIAGSDATSASRWSSWFGKFLKAPAKLMAKRRKAALLPPLAPEDTRKTLVLDLDETLVHSCFQPIPNPDFIIPVKIGKAIHNAYVLKRPGVDQFLAAVGKHYEVVVFTASLSKYADPVVDQLDTGNVVSGRLFREACARVKGNFIKDLSLLGRDLSRTIIIDNAPISYMFHPQNAIPCTSWFDDPTDTELLDLIPLMDVMASAEDVVEFLEQLYQAQAMQQQGGPTTVTQ